MNRNMMRWPDGKRRAVTLSYDDGTVFDRRLVEILDRYGLVGTFNLNSGLFAAVDADKGRMTKEATYALFAASPHEIAVHGERHLSLPTVPESVAVLDVLNDRVALEAMFGRLVQGMAYAYGTCDDGVAQILHNAGIRYARTTVSTERFDVPRDWLRMPATCHHKNPRLFELATKFIEDTDGWNSPPMLFYLWGHSYEFNNDGNWDVIERFAAYIGSRDNVWYATNGEIYRYVAAFDALEFSACGDCVYNPTVTDVFIHYMNRDYRIGAGKTVALVPRI